MKIVLCEFHQESNSFNSEIVSREPFEYYGIHLGGDMRKKIQNKPRAIAGMFKVLDEMNVQSIPSCSMYSQSGGPVDHNVLEWFINKTILTIRQNMPMDGVFVSLHGSTQTTEVDDASGLILEQIRKEAGPSAIISASADLHANVTEKMIKNADFICGYHTYPHIDYYETGYRAAKLGMEKLISKNKLHLVRVGIPMIVPANSYTTMEGPFSELMAYGESLVTSEKLIDFSIFQMQPWLDVSDGASSILTVAKDTQTAESYAVELAERLLALRKSFKKDMCSIDEVIELAEKNTTDKPVILADSADSTNAGAAGDSVAVLQRLIEIGSDVKTAFVLSDVPAVEKAFKLGVGERAVFSLGGTRNPDYSKSIDVEAEVKSLHNGTFTQEGPAGRGTVISIGRTAVLTVNNIDIVVCHDVAGNGDPQLYRAFGIEPSFYDIVVVKANTSFKAAYHLIADVICPTNTPGAAAANLLALDFKKIPKSFYPFSSLDDYRIQDIIYGRK